MFTSIAFAFPSPLTSPREVPPGYCCSRLKSPASACWIRDASTEVTEPSLFTSPFGGQGPLFPGLPADLHELSHPPVPGSLLSQAASAPQLASQTPHPVKGPEHPQYEVGLAQHSPSALVEPSAFLHNPHWTHCPPPEVGLQFAPL